MTSRPRKPLMPALVACLLVAAPAGTADAGLKEDWAAVIAASGRGDHATAVRLVRALAEQGDADAQYDLGALYHGGEDLPADYVQAYKWYDLAASRFTEPERSMRDRAVKSRDRTGAMMTPAQIAEAQRLVREWKPAVR